MRRCKRTSRLEFDTGPGTAECAVESTSTLDPLRVNVALYSIYTDS
jgi:hypothetical protein